MIILMMLLIIVPIITFFVTRSRVRQSCMEECPACIQNPPPAPTKDVCNLLFPAPACPECVQQPPTRDVCNLLFPATKESVMDISCSSNTMCPPNYFCSNKKCVPRLGARSVCSANFKCSSNACVDGKCL